MNTTQRNDADNAPEAPFVFLENSTPPPEEKSLRPWKVLIVDDDNEIHNISHLVLRDFRFEGRPLAFFSAHSGETAKRLLAEHPDTALMLLDVVMETDNAGLEVVRHVRETLKNHFVRIILRTGQPGQAPESSVVIDYDINDYKEKTELTAQKLVTTVVSALRAYRDMQIIESSRRGLEHIIHASSNLFEPQSLAEFCRGVLLQLTSLLKLGGDSFHIQHSGFAVACETNCPTENFRVLSGNGQFTSLIGQCVDHALPQPVLARLDQARRERRTLIDDQSYVGHFITSNGSENLIYLMTGRPLSEFDERLLYVFSINIGIAFDNIRLNEELADTQTEIIHTLSEAVETRSNETGRHVLRVGEYARLLGELAGLAPEDYELLRIAAPMHDVGKIGIADALLNKPGRYSSAEFTEMKQHAALGHNILKGSRRPPLRMAAIVAEQHHEWWDGNGYPHGLAGENIHIFGRIVALADVFDALSHPRCYKPAWPLEQVAEYIRDQSGTQFDPRLVEIFLVNLPRFVDILKTYPDSTPDQSATDTGAADAAS